MTLTDANGIVQSENLHTLLIDDQNVAKAALKARHRANAEKLDTYARSYYRFFPEQMQLD